MNKYDIIVIGAGSGGLNIAGFMNKAGFNVLLIDKSDKDIGGDCLNFGCVPSKALIHISKLAHNAKEMNKFGLKSSGNVSIKKVVEYIRDKKEFIRKHENADYFRSIGMDVKLGKAVFSGKNSVKVGENEYTAKRIILATGSRPRELKVPGLEKVEFYNNENVFNITKFPKRLLVVGGGPIGIEIGQAFLRLGSEVSVIQRGDSFLPKESPEITEVLQNELKKEGMKFYFNSSPKKFLSRNKVLIECKGKKNIKVEFDAVFASVGRVLNIEGLGLKNAGIEVEKGRIKVDDRLRTTNKRVFLCGDIAGGYQFTHAAELHAGVIISNFFSPFKKKVSYDDFSWVTYTDPEIATFGINEEEIKRRDIEYEKLESGFEEDDRTIVDGKVGRVVLYVSKGKLLGGTMVASNAGELFQELVLVKSAGLKMDSLFNKIYAYPTASRINKRVASDYFSRKLNGFVKRILRVLY